MVKGCKYSNFDGKQCGHTIFNSELDLCQLHSIEKFHNNPDDKRALIDYLSQKEHVDYIDLSNLEFNSFEFTDRIFSKAPDKGLPLLFRGSNFTDCTFTNFATKLSFDFANSDFNSCQFQICQFLGKRTIFSGASFYGTRRPFVTVTFLNSERVSFESVYFESEKTPFADTDIRADKISLANSYFDSPRLRINIARRDFHWPQDDHHDLPRGDYQYLILRSNDINLSRIVVTGSLEMSSAEITKKPQDAPDIDCSEINFTQMSNAVFVRADLKRTRFLNSVLNNVTFIGEQWPQGPKDDNRIIFDHLVREKGSNAKEEYDYYKSLRFTYIQLKKNYDSNSDNARADQWHYREMQCRKEMFERYEWEGRFPRTKKFISLLLFRLYGLASGYGDNYRKAFLWLVILLGSFAVAYCYNGFEIFGKTVNYRLAWDFDINFLGDFFKAVFFTLATMLPHPDISLMPLTNASKVIRVAQIVLFAIQFPLFLLALRRKFKR